MATRRPKTLDFWWGDLPHWQVEDGHYFVTIHLYGSIPEIGHQRIHELCEQHRISENNTESNLDLHRKIFSEMERWLDRLPTVSHFRQPKLCEMVIEAIEHRRRARVWEMHCFVIMPSHIHLFFELSNELSLKRELEEFKRWTGHQAAKLDGRLSRSRFWQTEWFDHWSRSDEEDEKIVRYIRNNPIKAGIVNRIGDYPFCG